MSDETTKDLTNNLSDRDLLLALTRDVRAIKAELNAVNRRGIALEEQGGRIEQELKAINATLRAIQRDRANDQREHELLVERVERLEAA